MNTEDLAPFALQRVVAHDGLAIDAATWTDAHSYHEVAQRLHARVMHGTGIVTGLHVTPTDPPSRALVLQPGVAIDGDGNVIRVPQPLQLDVTSTAKGPLCFVLSFAETAAPSGNGAAPRRMLQSYQLLECTPPRPPTEIEVARVEIVDPAAPILPAGDAWTPQPGEIDERFRRQLRPYAGETLTIGQLSLTDPAATGLHRRGLLNVIRELQDTAPFMVRFVGDVPLEHAADQCDLLYVTGAGEIQLAPRQAASLLAFVRGGGVMYCEPCVAQEQAIQEDGRFVASFIRLMSGLKFLLDEVGPEHPLFYARHAFGVPPDGVGGHAPILGLRNVILNPNDYGCCWQGGPSEKPLARERIRDATEFAVNVAWYAMDPAVRAPAAAAAAAPTKAPVPARG